MDENLVGYLLNSLETDEHKAVERYLEENTEARQKLETLKSALAPLAADREQPMPPPGLWLRALSRVAEHQCKPEEDRTAASLRFATPVAGGRSWYRRSDLLVAASIFLCVGLLIPPGISYMRFQRDKAACQDNQRVFYNALSSYSDQNNGMLPNIATTVSDEHNVAGMVVPILYEKGYLDDDFRKVCPSNGRRPLNSYSVPELKAMNKDEFKKVANQLSGCYAYTLGYEENGKHAVHRLEGESRVPLLGDRPPPNPVGNELNSPNHGGRGQNVLFSDGHAEFRSNRFVNAGDDDIYLNHSKKVAAGRDRYDAVLGSSDSHP